jgi:hypothetical protein
MVVEETMTTQRTELRAAIAEVQQAPRGHRFYGKALKQAIAEYAIREKRMGRLQKEIAADLHLSTNSLGKWLRHEWRRRKRGTEPSEPAAGDK